MSERDVRDVAAEWYSYPCATPKHNDAAIARAEKAELGMEVEIEAERDYWRDRALTADAELAELRETIRMARKMMEDVDNEQS